MSNVIPLVDSRSAARPMAAVPAAATTSPLGAAQELLQMLGGGTQPMREPAALQVLLRRVRAGEVLFHEGAAAEALHFVRAGSFKIVRTAEDGYEQVLGFVGRGEVLGFDAVCTESHPTAAVALEDSSVYAVRLRDLFDLGARVAPLHMLVERAASSALQRLGELADVMSAVAAEVRLARFLMQWSRRMAEQGQSPRRFHLRMTRRDIASHLGVAHETVSRSFGVLSRLGLVQVHNREIELLDVQALHAFSTSTRRPSDDGDAGFVPPRNGLRA